MRLKIKQWFRLCPVRHVLVLLGGGVILLHLLTRGNRTLMQYLSERLVRPLHRALGAACDRLPFSVAELLIAVGVALVLVYLGIQTVCLVRKGGRLKRLYRTLMTAAAAFCMIYGGFCVLWGVYYYGDDFCQKAGLSNAPIAVEDLRNVTELFARIANAYAGQVSRDETGAYTADREKLLAQSAEVFAAAEQEFPALAGDALHAKGVKASRIMSYTDFTGFFSPFTGEANVNTDFPPSLFASTIAHELSHQRGVAKEQEANFTAILACFAYGDAEYVYSAALLGYTYLGNALYSADYEGWYEIASRLEDGVNRDFAVNRAYWQQFETPVQKVSNTVYEGFLQSYDQNLGLKSYGACVDLLVNYYGQIAGELCGG